MTKEELISLVNENICYKNHLNNDIFDKLEKLIDVTLEANEKFNLTAIKDKDSFRELMIYDSLLPLKYFDLNNKSVLDIGTGAGFPGLPLAISTQGEYTLLDSTNKKISHICCVIDDFKFENACAICDRVEDYATNNREAFDYVVARAVASLNILCELCLPLVKVGGSFIAMKGANGLEELEQSKKAISKLGGEISIIKTDELPLSKEKRITIEIKKIKETNKKYPRAYGDIKNKPL